VFADQVGADLLQPFRLDLRDAAREQARSLDQFGGDDPAPGLLGEAGAGVDVKTDAACAQIILVFFADEADVAEQAGEQGLVDSLVGSRQLVLLPAMLGANHMQLRVHIAPLAQAQPVDEVLPAPLALLVAGLVLPYLVGGSPELQVGEELGFLVLPLCMRLVGGSRVLLRPVARILCAERGGDDQYLAQAVVLARGEDHAANLRVERELGQLEADLGQFLAGLVDGAQFGKQLISVGDHARQRRLEEREVLDIAQMQRLHAQDHAGQAGTQDFRLGVGRALVEILLVVELEADTGRDPAATPRALAGRRARDRFDLQLLDLVAMGVTLDPRQARVDHIADAGHGQRGLGDVGRQHHAAALVRGKDAGLLGRRLPGEQRQYVESRRMVLAQGLGRFADFALAGQEDQHVARPGPVRLVDGIDDGVIEIRILLLVEGAEARFDRIEPARDFDHRRAVEMFAETFGVQRGGGNDELQVAPLRQ
jgi:hypothetical protein